MNQEIENNREEFLTPADFGKNGVSKEELEKINNHPLGDGEKYKGKYRMEKFDSSVDEIEEEREREKEKKKQKSEIDGQIVLSEEIIIKKSNNRVDFLDNEKPIGKTPTGLPLYRSEDTEGMYKSKIEKTYKVENKILNKNFLAFIDGKSIKIIKDFLGTEISDSELTKKIVAFKSGIEIFFDKGDPTIRLHNSIFAIRDNRPLDESDCPAKGLYINLANLVDSVKYPKIAKRGNATINDSNLNHLVNFPRGREFFANPKDAIEVKVSNKNKNGIIERH